MSIIFAGSQAKLLLSTGEIDKNLDRLPQLVQAVRKVVEAHNETARYLGNPAEIIHLVYPTGHLAKLHHRTYLTEVLNAFSCGEGVWFQHGSYSFLVRYNLEERAYEGSFYYENGSEQIRQYLPFLFPSDHLLTMVGMINDLLYSDNPGNIRQHPNMLIKRNFLFHHEPEELEHDYVPR